MIKNKLNSFIEGSGDYFIWGTLGWHDIKQRYRRSIIGPFWFTISILIVVYVLGFLYSSLLNQNLNTYLPYLAGGLLTWQFISATLNDSCNIFIESSYLIKQIPLPLSIYIFRTVWRNFLISMHSFPILILLYWIFYKSIATYFILSFCGLILLFVHGVWVSIILAILATRFRDIVPIVNNLTQLSFFFTPIMWFPEILKDKTWVVSYNPFYHIIQTIRDPILSENPDFSSFAWSIAIAIVGLFLAKLFLSKYKNRVVYWI